MPLSLEELKDILKHDEEKRYANQAIREQFDKTSTDLRRVMQEVYQHHGVLAPITGTFWQRPIPATLYKCPVSTPQTTLVTWKSLPKPFQDSLPSKPTKFDEHGDALIEIPTSFLSLQHPHAINDSNPSGTSINLTALQNRPLGGGNLSDKLSEYTRGLSGVRRPFLPGGGDDNIGSVSKNNKQALSSINLEQKEDPYRTPEAIERSLRVLKQGVEASWKDGSLITAPPGVDFKVGLSWESVYGSPPNSNECGDDNEIVTQHSISADRVNTIFAMDTPVVQKQPVDSLRLQSQPLAPNTIFTRNFFEDDSLFGSSSSSSESESDNLTEKYIDNNEEESNDGKDFDGSSFYTDSNRASVTVDEHFPKEKTSDDDDIDFLIKELKHIGDGPFTVKKVPDDILNNPIKLAERLSQDQKNIYRKSWASTTLLPIREFAEYVPNPALTYPFTLDEFQQQAIARLERSESVFVAAHTSAGKTVIAEYAVALARQRATRCVYTSPIKALSNQKFRDFSLKFGAENIGLITGDMQVNADDSTCIIMTTEILRSMLYRGADLIRDIEYVIFDEVHYVNDTERGVVWEEVIIMLPSYVTLIFLSATTPNTFEFSDWIGRTKRKPVYVVKTDYRPVPLSYHLWAGNKLHKIMEGKTYFEKGYMEATNALLPASAKDPKKKNDPKLKTGRLAMGSKNLIWQQQGDKQDWMSLIRYLDSELLTPTVVFVFSKKKCEEIANLLQSLDLNTARERGLVQGFTLQTVSRLSTNDVSLPQVIFVCEMVQRGIGIHHGGLLPILKEMVEILFSRNLIKVLFATETFAMGVNMPARSVVFNSIRKHDGNNFRNLEPGELTQMSGRAGRRGLDTVGTVVFCCFGETPPPQSILRQMLTGSSTVLKSQFRLTYNMILNLLRVEELSVESMIKRSFSEFATQRELTANEYPQLLRKGEKALAKLEQKILLEASTRVGAEDVEEYFDLITETKSQLGKVVKYIKDVEPTSYESILQPGRVILVNAALDFNFVCAPAIVLRIQQGDALGRQTSPQLNSRLTDTLVCMVLLPLSFIQDFNEKLRPEGTIGFVGSVNQRYYALYNLQMNHLLLLSTLKQKIDPSKILVADKAAVLLKDDLHPTTRALETNNPFAGLKALGSKEENLLTPASSKANESLKKDQVILQIMRTLIEAEKNEKEGNGLGILDLRPYLKRGDDVILFRKMCDEIDSNISLIRSMKSHHHPSIERYMREIERLHDIRGKVSTLNHLLSNESLHLFPDFIQRKAVLHKLGYVDSSDTVCIKGRVACEVNSCDELIATELVFEGLLNNMAPEEIAAVLSSLVYEEKRDEVQLDSELPESIVSCCSQMRSIAENLGHIQKASGLEIDPGEYADASLRFGLVHVVYEWALGVPFKNICELTDVQEGSIVRCVTRLDELCREIRNCARVVGNPTIYQKMEEASTCIKRDIVFASSLYVS